MVQYSTMVLGQNATTVAIIAAVVTAIAAPIGAYVLAARKMSGQIDTSTAADLWKESRDIRDDYRSRLQAANEKITELETRVDRLERINEDLLLENRELKQKISELQAIIERLQATIEKLRATIEDQTSELRQKGQEP